MYIQNYAMYIKKLILFQTQAYGKAMFGWLTTTIDSWSKTTPYPGIYLSCGVSICTYATNTTPHFCYVDVSCSCTWLRSICEFLLLYLYDYQRWHRLHIVLRIRRILYDTHNSNLTICKWLQNKSNDLIKCTNNWTTVVAAITLLESKYGYVTVWSKI